MTRTYAESFQLLSTQLELIGDPRPDVASPPRHDDPAPVRRRPAFSAEQEAQLTWSEPGPEPQGG